MHTHILIFVATLLSTASAFGAAKTASAAMMSKSDTKATGRVDFAQDPTGLTVNYDLRNLPKKQTLGFHIHESGDCSSKDAKSAGPHYAKLHGSGGGTSTDFPDKYAGDLPQVTTDENGSAKGQFRVQNLTLDGENAIQDRSIILHGGPDDIKKKSAPRIACGLIKVGSN